MKAILFLTLFFSVIGCSAQQNNNKATPLSFKKQIANTLHDQIVKEAEWALKRRPVTVTAQSSSRSAGGKHDFFSEGDYWWPDPRSADSPYIQRDGMTNPDNFVAHRHAMIRFSRIVGALASAYQLTGKDQYVRAALAIVKHGSSIPPL